VYVYTVIRFWPTLDIVRRYTGNSIAINTPVAVDLSELLQFMCTCCWPLPLLLPLLLHVSLLCVPLTAHADILATSHCAKVPAVIIAAVM
jgi:hypothetical protein